MRPIRDPNPAWRILSIVLLAGTCLTVPVSAHARPEDYVPLLVAPAPARDPGAMVRPADARSDTVDFGYYEIRPDGQPYALLGEEWTWDHGAADPLEGWTPDDLTSNDADFWRQVTEASWAAEGNPAPWPMMNASLGIALCGARQGYADSLGWPGGLGYGVHWCQYLTSPAFMYDGSGEVGLSFHYFNDTETDWHYSRVFAETGTGRTFLNEPGFNGKIGIDSLGVITQALYTRTMTNAELGGGFEPREVRIVLEVLSDCCGSDEGVGEVWDSFYGAIGVDDVELEGSNLSPPLAQVYDFEDGLQGWTASHCAGVGSFLGAAPLTAYLLADPCFCALSGNVIELHDDVYLHPDGQHEIVISPIVDRVGDLGDPGYLAYNKVFAEWTQYSELPMGNGVFFRGGWSYYPYENPDVPGLVTWSPRVGSSTFYYTGVTPECSTRRDIGTDWALPADCQQVKFIYELYGSCDAFGVDPCTGITNFTPLVDNLRVRMTEVSQAPMLAFEPGCRYQDGFSQSGSGYLSTTDPGNSDIALNVRMTQPGLPARLGDSLVVSGPYPGTQNQWEAKLWFRLARRGPGQNGNGFYNTWKNALLAAKGIDFFTPPNPPFTWGYMDSVEVGGSPQRTRFCSQFRDGPSPGGLNLPPDPNYNWGGGGEQAEGNEIIPDLALTPGTMIQYFVTAAHISNPAEYSSLPDTSGGNFAEFEILPSFRLAEGETRFPGFLYIDASNRASDQGRIEAALWSLHSGGAGPIPEPRPWDRYDYADAASSWRASFYRQSGGNSGAQLGQLLGYRSILMDLGTLSSGATVARDWQGLQAWLTATWCSSGNRVQALYLSGSSVARVIDELDPAFLNQSLGATRLCDSYGEFGCPPGEVENDENFCVRLEPAGSCPAPPQIPMDVQGNWCPVKTPFGVLGTTGTGAGNLVYQKVGSEVTADFAQVRNDRESPLTYRYRSIINGFNLGSLAARSGDSPATECPSDSASVVAAIRAELETAFGWLSCRSIVENPLTRDPCTYAPPYETCLTNAVPSDPTAATMVNSLGASRPNPAGSRTVISYSLANDGPARLDIFSVEGRRVRTLVDAAQKAGLHQADWDGTDDSGHPVGAGIYWSRLQVGNWASDRKMVVLR